MACNELSSKSFCYRWLAIGFPRKVFAVDGLQSTSLEKFLLSTAYNWLPSKSKYYLRLTIRLPQKVSAVYGLQSTSLKK